MKKSIMFIAALGMLVAAASCRKDTVVPVSFTVNVDESALVDVPLPEAYTVSLTNLSTAEVTTMETENSVATFSSVVPGLYTVSALASASENGVSYNFSGTASSVEISVEGQEVTIAVTAAESGSLVFKEIYYACSGDYYIREQFYEVYNNSDVTVYLDGLCIAEIDYYDQITKAPYNWQIENPEKYVFASDVWQIPGDGTSYPLEPGESVVIAEWATDHSMESLNPGSAIGDLSSADFEAITGETTVGTTVITDNAAINMEHPVMAYSLPQWLTSTGGATMVIFYPEYELNSENMIAAEGLYGGAREIPVEWILDGVNAVSDATMIQYKGLPDNIDAGTIWVDEAYSGQSIARKISETKEDGRIVYMDTNNTTNDFEVMDKPEIRRNGAKIPSWNTWAN